MDNKITVEKKKYPRLQHFTTKIIFGINRELEELLKLNLFKIKNIVDENILIINRKKRPNDNIHEKIKKFTKEIEFSKTKDNKLLVSIYIKVDHYSRLEKNINCDLFFEKLIDLFPSANFNIFDIIKFLA